MKNLLTYRFYFLLSFLLVIAMSCTKDQSKPDQDTNVNKSIYFEANVLNDISATTYGVLDFGKRPANIDATGLTYEEIVTFYGEIFTVITITVSSGKAENILPAEVNAYIKLIKPGKGIEGRYQNKYADPLAGNYIPTHLAISTGIDFMLREPGLEFNIRKTAENEIIGPYVEGDYSFSGESQNGAGITSISGKFRLYLSKR